MDYAPIIRIEKSLIITDAILAEVKKHYPGLEIRESKDSIDLIVEKLTKTQIGEIQTDLVFYHQNPVLPIENICSNFSNYKPKNKSQGELLRYAGALCDIQDPSIAAGLFIYGEPGVGKTHMSVAVTKKLMKTGQKAHFFSADDYRSHPKDEQLGPNQVWIIDDLNNPYGVGMGVFKKIVLNAHNKGGRVFVTSNTDYNELLEHAFIIHPEEKLRYMDRTKGMFKTLYVIGESNRTDKAWYTDIELMKKEMEEAIAKEKYEEAARLRDLIKEKMSKKSI